MYPNYPHHHEHDTAYLNVFHEDPFKATIELESSDLVGVPFTFSYYTVPQKPREDCECLPPARGQKKYSGYWSSDTDCNRIRKVDSNTYLVAFPSNHRIGCGYLILEVTYKMPDTDYECGYAEITRRYNCFTFISDERNSDDVEYDVTSEIFVKCFRGPQGSSGSADVTLEGLGLKVEMIGGKPVLTIGTQQFELTPYVYIVSTEYADPVISISYSDINADGGSVSPRISVSQKKITTYSNGSTTEETIGGGDAVISYSSTNNLVNAQRGNVVATASTITSKHKVDTVTVSATLNGKTATKSVDVYQAAYVAPVPSYDFYLGQITKTSSAFAALTDSELLASATKQSTNASKSAAYSCQNSVVFVLIPTSHSHLALSKFDFTSGGMTTHVLTDDAWNVQHADVTIDGVTYKVYAYRNGGVNAADPMIYDYSITYTK